MQATLLCHVCLFAVATSALASAQAWKLVKPSTTGIPGEEVRIVRIADDGHVWVGARWPFWTEGGIGVYDPSRDLWTTFNNVDGSFPSAFVNDLVWAPDGTAWIATGNGLVHWDSGVAQVYTTANSPLLHNTIADLDVDSAGHVWLNNTTVGSTRAAIFEFDGRDWRSFQVGSELPWAPPWGSLSHVLVDRDDHVWVANEVLNGIAEFDGTTWTLHGASFGRVGSMAEDTAGNLWLRAGVGGGNWFAKYDGQSFTRYPIATTPTAIGIDDDGAVFLGDWLGTIRKTTDAGRSFTVWASGLNKVFNIAPDPRGTDVWIGTIGALGHFDGAGRLLADYNSYNTGQGDYFIDKFDVDRSGNLWIAAGESGLTQFDGLRWRNWGDHNVGSEPYPFAGNEPMGTYYEDRSGIGWMGGNGIARWDPPSGTFTGFWNWQNTPSIGVTMFDQFAEDAAGNLFAATEYGTIYRFDGRTWVVEPIRPYAPNGTTMLADSRGDVWLAGWFDVWRWDGRDWRKIALPDPNYFFDLGGINVMANGPDDVKWFGTDQGLVRYDGTSFEEFHRRNSPLPARQVAGLDVRDDGVIGLACLEFGAVTPFPNGVCVIDGDPRDPTRWKVWSYGSSPLPHYQLGAAKFDADGNLWVSAVSESAAVLLNPAQPLATDTTTLPASIGGRVELTLDAGAAHANEGYAVVGTLAGASPGTTLPNGLHVPINLDSFSALTLSYANSPVFVGFNGTLDQGGRAAAAVVLPPLPSVAGTTAHFAYVLVPSFGFASNAVRLGLSP